VYQDEFIAAAKACIAAATGNPAASLEEILGHGTAMDDCMAPQNRLDTIFSFAGAGAIVVLGVIVMLFVPTVLRRRRRLRPAGANMAAAVDRVGELAAEAGLRKAPKVMVGPMGHRDAFVFGLPGRYSIVLPMALLVKWRNRDLFDPVVRHEIGHLRRHDVLMAWLAASVWLAAPVIFAVLLVPLATDLDLSLLPHYLWRVALLIGLVWLVRRQLLRSREHDADLHVARQMRDWRPLWKVLASSAGPAPGFWRRWISNHPAAAERQRVLVDPATAPGVSFVDGLVAAFLAGAFFPIVFRTIGTAMNYTWAPFLAGLVAGPLLGLAVGAGLWRQALIDHAAGTSRWPGGAVGGVVTGLLLAYLTEFGYVVGDQNPFSWLTIALIIVVGAGVVLLSAGTGRLWADAAAGLPAGRTSWAISVVINALLFGFAIWILGFLPPYLEILAIGASGPVDIVVVLGGIISPIAYLAIIPALVTMYALVARRKVANIPTWITDSVHTGIADVARKPGLGAVLFCSVAAGLVAAAGVLAHRLAVGPPVDGADSLNRYVVWISTGTLVALAVSFASVAMVPRSGGAVGLVAGAVTAMTAGLAMVGINTFGFGNILDLEFLWTTIMAITALWFLGHLLILVLTLLTWLAPWRDVSGWLFSTVGLTAAMATSMLVTSIAIASWG
jgi:Zn-dependent protease with chaperone function